MGTWIKCINENGQDIYANLENSTTIFRDEGRHRGTVIEFLGSHDAVVVRETPDQILKAKRKIQIKDTNWSIASKCDG